MTTLLFVFITALVLSLVLTPLVTKFSLRYDIVHVPNERCTHTTPMPRIGGVAIYLAFVFSLLLCVLFRTDVSDLLLHENRMITILVAGTLVFSVGLWDDLRSLPASVKLLCQMAAGLITWLGGIQINVLSISLTSGLQLDWLSLPITLFWIVLVVNAINLIDGLDGLAAGVVVFTSLIMLLLCVVSQKYLISLGFAAIAGATLGFLRYNFNPASIFMGDSGSYFLGYTVATFSILGSLKGQTTLAMLIPFIALGVPLFDALLAPVRRFFRGQKLFSPDQRHMHHRLIKKGLTHRNAVLFLYSITVLLGSVAFTLIYARDELAFFILLVPTAVCFFTFRKLGYLDYLASDKVYGWLCDLKEASGISHDRRTFLDIQLQINKSQSLDEMWDLAGGLFERLNFDTATLLLSDGLHENKKKLKYKWHTQRSSSPQNNFCLKLDLPLVERKGKLPKKSQNCITSNNAVFLGTLILKKNIEHNPINYFTLRRVEQLRNVIIKRLGTGF